MPGMAGQPQPVGGTPSRSLLALAIAGLLGMAGLAAWHFDQPVPIPAEVAPLALTGRVVDRADILSSAQEAALDKRLARLEEQAGPQLVVVTTPSLEGQTVADYSLRLGRGWGIGDKARNDGVILLVAPNERKVRIEVGYGLEKTLSDPRSADIIKTKIIPMFKRGDLTGGTLAGANEIAGFLEAHPTKPGKPA